MPLPLFIEDYTQQSFVVRGDTREYKDSLKALGGKWNTMLTNKDTGEKFGAWVFWSVKRKEISSWIEKGCQKVIAPISSTEKDTNDIKRLEKKMDYIIKMLESLSGKKLDNSDVDSDIEYEEVVPKKRLL
jgi:hypothetical protein